MIKTWVWICVLLNLHYAVQFVLAYLFWRKVPTNFSPVSSAQRAFSIVVAMRNEEGNIEKLIESLLGIDYPKELYEVILVDDFSEDGTVQLAQKLIEKHKENADINLVSLKAEGLTHNKAYKKTAIQFGVSKAKYEWIVTTDADCVHPKGYLKTLHGFIDFYKPKFVSAPVELSPTRTIFQKMQALEFRGLVALGATYIQREKPFLCNGANMAFKKEVFEQLNGFKGFEHFESGDDIWFMHKVQERYPFEIYFARHRDMIVKSEPCENLKAFISQRKRWTAKNSSYKKWSQTFTLAFDYLFYLALLVNLILGLFFPVALEVWLLMIFTKLAVEINFYGAMNKFYHDRLWLIVLLATFPFQIIYVVMIYPLSQLTHFKWKNRVFNA